MASCLAFLGIGVGSGEIEAPRSLMGCGRCRPVAALLATAVVVSHTTLVCVAAVEIVTSLVDRIVDVSTSAITMVARCVAICVMVWTIVDVIVTVSLSLSTWWPGTLVTACDSLHQDYDLHRGEALSLGAYLIARTTTRSATHLIGPAAEFPVKATVTTARTEVDIVAEAVVGAVGEAVSPTYIQGVFAAAEQRFGPGNRVQPSVVVRGICTGCKRRACSRSVSQNGG